MVNNPGYGIRDKVLWRFDNIGALRPDPFKIFDIQRKKQVNSCFFRGVDDKCVVDNPASDAKGS